MTNLSPAAQATYDAFNRIGLYNKPSFETDRKALAAALRAAADQVEQKLRGFSHEACQEIRAIAAELENFSND